MISLYSKQSTDKEVLTRSFYLATLTIFGLYCLRSCNSVFIVFPVSMISFKRAKRKTHVIAFRTKHYTVLLLRGNKSTYLHYQDILRKEKNHKLSKILSKNSKKKMTIVTSSNFCGSSITKSRETLEHFTKS